MESSSISSSCTKGIVLGVIGTLVALQLVPRIRQSIEKNGRSAQKGKSTYHRRGQPPPSSSPTTTTLNGHQEHHEPLMDAADLPLRLLSKAEGVLQYRSNLLIVIERCVNDFNYSAILRTAEALGVQHVWLVDPPPTPPSTTSVTIIDDDDEGSDHEEVNDTVDNSTNNPPSRNSNQKNTTSGHKKKSILTPQEMEQRKKHHLFAQKATNWLSIREFKSSLECLQALREQHYHVWATDLSQEAVPLTHECMPPHVSPTDQIALVFGTEAVGVSQEILDHADLRIYLPLRGFADSLNLSVATALVIHQVFTLYPTLIGNYPDKQALRQAWFTKLASQRIWTPRQKKEHRKLQTKISDCQNYLQKVKHGIQLTKDQQLKLDRLPEFEAQLAVLEQLAPACTSTVIQEYVHHPPPPLTDLRRADDHRATYVGKNTKRHHANHWQGMVATSNPVTRHMVTSRLFRDDSPTTAAPVSTT